MREAFSWHPRVSGAIMIITDWQVFLIFPRHRERVNIYFYIMTVWLLAPKINRGGCSASRWLLCLWDSEGVKEKQVKLLFHHLFNTKTCNLRFDLDIIMTVPIRTSLKRWDFSSLIRDGLPFFRLICGSESRSSRCPGLNYVFI